MLQSQDTQSLNHSDGLNQDDQSISFSHIFHIFWIRRYLFAVIFLFIMICGVVILFQLTPKYTAEAKILVGTDHAKVVDVEAVLSGDLTTDSAVKNETEILTSKVLAKKMIAKLNLLNLEEFNPDLKQDKGFFAELKPSEWLPESIRESLGLGESKKEPLTPEEEQERKMTLAVEIYLKKLKVSPLKGSQVINIAFESVDPKLAAQITNVHADKYITGQLDAKFEATQKATAWLNEQLAGLRTKVETSEKAVEVFRNQHGLTQGKDQAGLVGEQLSEINSQLIIAKAAKAEAAARLAQVTQLLKGGEGSDIESANEVISSALIQGLKQQEAELARKVSEMAVEFGAKHPKLIRANAEILDLRNKIKSEITKIAAGLKNELNIASTRESSLESSLSASASKSGANRKEEVQLRALEREANANKVLFETFLNRFKETSSTQGMEEADARVISAAEIPVDPSYPKKTMLMMLIGMLAVGAGSAVIFIIEMLHSGFRTPEEIEHYLGLSTIALLPTMTKKISPPDYVLDKPHSSFCESLGALRVSMMLSDPDKDVKTIMITSSLPAEGKSTLALCLGRSAAVSGQKVVVVDADFRRPTVEKKLNIDTKSLGLTDFIMAQDGRPVTEFMTKDVRSELHLMTKGQTPYINPVDIFSSHKMEFMLGELKKEFDLIIIDTPPIMVVTDARALASLVDKSIYVVAWDKTPRQVVRTGIEQLLKASPNLAGIVFQQVDFKLFGSYSFGKSGYYYDYGKYGQYYSD